MVFQAGKRSGRSRPLLRVSAAVLLTLLMSSSLAARVLSSTTNMRTCRICWPHTPYKFELALADPEAEERRRRVRSWTSRHSRCTNNGAEGGGSYFVPRSGGNPCTEDEGKLELEVGKQRGNVDRPVRLSCTRPLRRERKKKRRRYS